MVPKSNARCPLFRSPLAFSWSSTGFFGTDPDAFNTRPPGLAPVRPFAVLQRATREIKCGGAPCGTSGLRALPGHDRPYIPTSGFSGEALTPLLCGPYGQSQSPNRPDLHGRPVKSNAGKPAVRNRKRRALPPAGRYSFRRERAVLMRPHCIQCMIRSFRRFSWLRGDDTVTHQTAESLRPSRALRATSPQPRYRAPCLRYRYPLETGFKNRTHVRVRIS